MPFMRVLITGGAGFLGSHLCEYLLNHEHEVIVMDNLLTGRVENISHLIGQSTNSRQLLIQNREPPVFALIHRSTEQRRLHLCRSKRVLYLVCQSACRLAQLGKPRLVCLSCLGTLQATVEQNNQYQNRRGERSASDERGVLESTPAHAACCIVIKDDELHAQPRSRCYHSALLGTAAPGGSLVRCCRQASSDRSEKSKLAVYALNLIPPGRRTYCLRGAAQRDYCGSVRIVNAKPQDVVRQLIDGSTFGIPLHEQSRLTRGRVLDLQLIELSLAKDQ